MRVKVTVQSGAKLSRRARQVCSMFDVPSDHGGKPLTWEGDVPIESRDWSIGLIVGPSGCGETTLAREMFGEVVDAPLEWHKPSVIDDFDPSLSLEDITAALSSVGFNTIPAWLRPYGVLSNGEKFRVSMARRLLEGGELTVVDEFTSVVDRQRGVNEKAGQLRLVTVEREIVGDLSA
jgi:ABC-type ATPase with predicted acetyltransferase domain